jgi:hypothetical protein
MSLQRPKQLQGCHHGYMYSVHYARDVRLLCVYKLISSIKKLFRGITLTDVLVSHSGTSDDIHDTIIV